MSNPVGLVSLLVIGVVAVATVAYHYLWDDQSHGDYSYGSGSTTERPPFNRRTPSPNNAPPRYRRRPNRGESSTCSICLTDIVINESILSCNHVFHRHCIMQWYNEQRTCPQCRAQSKIIS